MRVDVDSLHSDPMWNYGKTPGVEDHPELICPIALVLTRL